MKDIILTISLLFFLINCSTPKKTLIAGNALKAIDTLEIVFEKEIKLGSNATFEFINKANNPKTIYGPWLKKIEKFENENWRKVRILNCPCGANCDAPPETLILQPLDKHSFTWSLMEGWCDKKSENGVPITRTVSSTPGLYRVSITFSTDSNLHQTINKEFNIIN